MDAGGVTGEEGGMERDPDDRGLWDNDLWRVAQALNRAAAAVSPGVASLPPLLLFTDPVRTPRPWEMAARLPPGAGVVYRGFGRAEMGQEAQALRRVSSDRNVVLLIGQDAALAECIGADGVHLAERDLARAGDLRARHPDWILTGAVHDPEAVQGLADLSALDALVLSPVFRAGGPSAARPPLGTAGIAGAVSALPVPVYGLGGISADTAHDLEGTGLCGLAGIEGVLRAFGPA